MERKLVSFDWAIKRLLRSKANFDILEGFLSVLLKTDITIIEILESESNRDTALSKFNRVDVKVRDSEQKIILIEIQYSREMDYLQRILFGTSKTIAEHFKEGDAYDRITKVISVNILYFDFGEGNDYVYHGTTSFVGIHTHAPLELKEEQRLMYQVNSVADIYPEYYLIEISRFNDVAKDSLDEWIYFLKHEEIPENFSAQGLREAKSKLDVCKMSPMERQAYERYQEDLHHEASIYRSTYVVGKMKGRAEGRAEGKAEEKMLIAKNLKNRGVSIGTIAETTGLSREEIERLS